MQPRVISTFLFFGCTIATVFLIVKGVMLLRIVLHEQTEETTKEITENLIKNLTHSLHSHSKRMPVSPTICRPGRGGDCVLPFIGFPAKYRTAPNYGLSACVIEKSMSTVIAGMMCLLYDPDGFINANRSISSDVYHSRFCKDKNEYNSMRQLIKDQPNMTFFAVVRDPIDRFISGFTDKCINEGDKRNGEREMCFGCGRNATCFVEIMYKRFMDIALNGKWRRFSFEDVHFSPQTWYCNFRMKLSEFDIIHYGTGEDEPRMVAELATLLKRQGVSNEIVTSIRKELLTARTPHATTATTDRAIIEREIRTDPFIMRTLVKMFYYDFVFLGYDLPIIPK